MSSITAFAGTVPENYDTYLGPYLFEPYALDLAERLKIAKCRNVLELACGTGRVTKHMAALIPADGTLVATDLNADMIAIAKTKVQDERVEWKTVDAHQLPFEDNHFDHVVCQYGVMFFQDKMQAFAETIRVLQQGGKFIFNTWGSLQDNPRTAVIIDVLTDMFKDEAPDFLQKGPYSFYNTNEIKQLLTTAGFEHVTIDEVKKTVNNWSIEDFINGFLKGSPLSAFISKYDNETRDTLSNRLKLALLNQAGEHASTQLLAYVCQGTKV